MANKTVKKSSKKNFKVWAVRVITIILAAVFVLGGLIVVLPTI